MIESNAISASVHLSFEARRQGDYIDVRSIVNDNLVGTFRFLQSELLLDIPDENTGWVPIKWRTSE